MKTPQNFARLLSYYHMEHIGLFDFLGLEVKGFFFS